MTSTHSILTTTVCLALLCLYGARDSALAAEPSRDRGNGTAALQIVTPYVKGEMPTAAELLTRCLGLLDKAETWKARLTLQATASDGPAEETYAGELLAGPKKLRATLRSSADQDRSLRLLISDTKAALWLQPDGGRNHDNDDHGDRARLGRVAGSIKLLNLVASPPGHPRRLSELAKAYQLSNKGVARVGKEEVYLVEAKPNGAEQADAPAGPIGGEPVVIAISLETSLPTRLVSKSADGARTTITLESIDLQAAVDEQSLAAKPPDGALVVKLDTATSTGSGPKNPIPYGAESIARGRRLYEADCVVCHSIDGTGRDSDVTDNAADLTDATHWISDGSDAATFLAIRDGAGDEMPGYEDEYGDDKSIWDLVNYIRSLRKKK